MASSIWRRVGVVAYVLTNVELPVSLLTMCYHPRVIIGEPEAPTKTVTP